MSTTTDAILMQLYLSIHHDGITIATNKNTNLRQTTAGRTVPCQKPSRQYDAVKHEDHNDHEDKRQMFQFLLKTKKIRNSSMAFFLSIPHPLKSNQIKGF
jgi:hypothetical protein